MFRIHRAALATLLLWSFQAKAADGFLCATSLSASSLGESWRKAHWRDGKHPNRFSNGTAVERAVKDPDLRALAVRWMILNASPAANGRVMDVAYQYLIFLGDLRIKFHLLPGEDLLRQKPLISLLQTLFDAYEANLITTFLVTELDAFLWEFVSRDQGLDVRRKLEALEHLEARVFPLQAILEQELNRRRQ